MAEWNHHFRQNSKHHHTGIKQLIRLGIGYQTGKSINLYKLTLKGKVFVHMAIGLDWMDITCLKNTKILVFPYPHADEHHTWCFLDEIMRNVPWNCSWWISMRILPWRLLTDRAAASSYSPRQRCASLRWRLKGSGTNFLQHFSPTIVPSYLSEYAISPVKNPDPIKPSIASLKIVPSLTGCG